jgi:hypothetical protein
MRFGVFHVSPNSGADPAVVAKHAEDLGFESYWVADHTIIPVKSSVRYPAAGAGGSEPDYLWQIPDPLIALTRASATTRRIRLGTGIRSSSPSKSRLWTTFPEAGCSSESAEAGIPKNARSSAATSIIDGVR